MSRVDVFQRRKSCLGQLVVGRMGGNAARNDLGGACSLCRAEDGAYIIGGAEIVEDDVEGVRLAYLAI